MKQATKQRIVGSIVLLALALIFLPIIFDGQGSYQAPMSSRIPEAPEILPLEQPQPQRPEIVADSSAIALETDTEPSPAQSRTNEEAAAAAVTVSEEAVSEESVAVDVAVVESKPDFSRELPQFDDSGLPRGWSVRLGSFSDASNAEQLLQRLQNAGYKAYLRRSDSNLSRVFVGPWLERGRAEDYLQRLEQEFQLAGMIVAYEIEPL